MPSPTTETICRVKTVPESIELEGLRALATRLVELMDTKELDAMMATSGLKDFCYDMGFLMVVPADETARPWIFDFKERQLFFSVLEGEAALADVRARFVCDSQSRRDNGAYYFHNAKYAKTNIDEIERDQGLVVIQDMTISRDVKFESRHNPISGHTWREPVADGPYILRGSGFLSSKHRSLRGALDQAAYRERVRMMYGSQKADTTKVFSSVQQSINQVLEDRNLGQVVSNFVSPRLPSYLSPTQYVTLCKFVDGHRGDGMTYAWGKSLALAINGGYFFPESELTRLDGVDSRIGISLSNGIMCFDGIACVGLDVSEDDVREGLTLSAVSPKLCQQAEELAELCVTTIVSRDLIQNREAHRRELSGHKESLSVASRNRPVG